MSDLHDTPAAAHLRDMRETFGVDSPEANAAFDARMAEVALEELTSPEVGLWMLSFCDPALAPPIEEQRPGGQSWLGTCVVEAIGPMDAVTTAHALGINPGGEVSMYGPFVLDAIGPEWRDRLLTYDEVLSIPEPEGWGG